MIISREERLVRERDVARASDQTLSTVTSVR